ncbi:MAG TPA: SDR family oxidoreductase [Oligoflexus sp.]|uniref:SDR family oxidoreductase n=1 Tax=Oligoflexus sp. TaxID=1971216 RepID=UPI002D7382F5|nr:SDR family oxidoreductase [Oligoflexus sp.]HYX38578.1 SDR family oxidoreductase [Oligoflexus sp.]
MHKRQLKGATVVVTGASSGIGKATALAFAAEGAHVVVAARRAEALANLVSDIEQMGGRALAVPTDVTDPEAVEQLAQSAANIFNGRIDVWFNNAGAGAGAVGSFSDVPLKVHEEVVRLNLLGCIHGAYAALPFFKRQNSGVLINMNSAGAFLPTAYAVAYSASKFGLRGFSEALRAEMMGFGDIHVCAVFASFVDTPGFEHAANYSGHLLKPAPPVYSPLKVAKTVVQLAQNPQHRRIVGWPVNLARLGYVLTPALSTYLMKRGLEHYFKKNADLVPITDGHVLRTSPQGQGLFG